MMDGDSVTLSPPPEGVVAGENVPRENELDDREERLVNDLMAKMKERGEPFISMKESELRERAIEKLQEREVIR